MNVFEYTINPRLATRAVFSRLTKVDCEIQGPSSLSRLFLAELEDRRPAIKTPRQNPPPYWANHERK